MIEPVSWQPVLAVAVSLVAAALILVTQSRPGLAMLWTLVAAVVTAALFTSPDGQKFVADIDSEAFAGCTAFTAAAVWIGLLRLRFRRPKKDAAVA